MLKNNLGYPRIGSQRELKKACESYWTGKISQQELLGVGASLRRQHWELQRTAGIDLIPSNDFSLYDHVLDLSLTLDAVPERYQAVLSAHPQNNALDMYFAMARGYQKDGLDIKAMEMTKWFDTNYHYIVPEFTKNQSFRLASNKIFNEFEEALRLGILTKPVLLGPVSYLLVGKEKEEGFHRLDLLPHLLPVYCQILERLHAAGAEWVQFDEPCLALDLTYKEKDALRLAYGTIRTHFPNLKTLLTTYFDGLRDNILTASHLSVCALHVDLVRFPSQFDDLLIALKEPMSLSLGIIDGRNIWKNDYARSLPFIQKAIAKLGPDRVMIAPSCSLLHCPSDLASEKGLPHEIKNWLAFAKQKLQEITDLYDIAVNDNVNALIENQAAIMSRRTSPLIHKQHVKKRVAELKEKDTQRKSPFEVRQNKQKSLLNLPLFPTTTIGSFPQTEDVRQLRAKYKKGELSPKQYEAAIEQHIQKAVKWQEELGLDVLVHGEFERNDMVEYFGEQLEGYVFTQNGWVQSYGSRCVKPPILYGDIERPQPMTVRWTVYAQSLTQKYMKGMLTGPITILQWSFVRDDQPRSDTMMQLALAIRDEVADLERAGIKIIQIDEAAIREGLPLRKSDRRAYLDHAVQAFRLSAAAVRDETQIHTHMCYSEFSDIIENIAAMDADVITIETSRSQMELLDDFAGFNYPNEIGPGVYDIHSPRVPTVEEMVGLLKKALTVLPASNLWVNPDCGLKTRKWPETEAALKNMVEAAGRIRRIVEQESYS
ncbi:5-methyltetrahydropteroyltriglutamate--homocysteine S-methyltransferase [Runella sp. CRIBMP]|uniref:5-methyltetrahydropteroyltriglutamate-- homocysteine S-methyltransferase n=1 Tax=Runella sp. CRIBMP TaxID=2683261 RepID=UPI00141315BA|nr:5-methyltetrahydropteroyltriglutamate--homocysteine S-methyltransferase [Runella sp. CRIBMP]NBB22808.1 5-methyltetrahydropteroyltriglutamate--homocysteine S-methyltransferase [Runella sp. CRIBMP]